MFYCSQPPSPPLSPFVRMFWLYEWGPHPQEYSRWLPSGTAQIVIDLSGDGLPIPELSTTGSPQTLARALFNGADTRYFFEENHHPMYRIGVDFKPGGAYPFFGPPASQLRDVHLPLETRCTGSGAVFVPSMNPKAAIPNAVFGSRIWAQWRISKAVATAPACAASGIGRANLSLIGAKARSSVFCVCRNSCWCGESAGAPAAAW